MMLSVCIMGNVGFFTSYCLACFFPFVQFSAVELKIRALCEGVWLKDDEL